MMKYLLLAFLMLRLTTVDAQDVLLGLHTGLGTYGMKELSTFNESYMNRLPFDAELVDDFPAWIFFKGTIGGSWKTIETGLSYASYSTGSRYALEDYSGFYQFDNRIKAEGPGIWFNVCLKPQWKIRLLLSNEISLLSTTLRFEEYLSVYEDELVNESYRLVAKDVIWEPGFKAQYPLGAFKFECFLAYAIQFRGDGLVLKADRGEGNLTAYGDNVHPGWNGIRLGFGAFINFSSMKGE